MMSNEDTYFNQTFSKLEKPKIVKIRQLSFELVVQDFYHYKPVFNENFLYLSVWIIDKFLYRFLKISNLDEIDSDENIPLQKNEEEIPCYLYSSCLCLVVTEKTITDPMISRLFLNKELDPAKLEAYCTEISHCVPVNSLPLVTPFTLNINENETQKNIIKFILSVALVKPFITVLYNADILRESAAQISKNISNISDANSDLQSMNLIEKCIGYMVSEMQKLKSVSN